MSLWHKIIHRVQITINRNQWFQSLEKDVARIYKRPIEIVFDVGAHKGQTSLQFRKCFPFADIHAFEPSPKNFRALQANLRGRDRIKPHPYALGQTQASALLDEGVNDLGCQLVARGNQRGRDSLTEVRVDTIDNYLQENKLKHIDLLKLDVEGSELDVLRGGTCTLRSKLVNFIVAECDFNAADTQHSFFPDLLEFLTARNFLFFGLYDVIHYRECSGIGFCNALFLSDNLS